MKLKGQKLLMVLSVLFLTACQSAATGNDTVKEPESNFQIDKEVTEIEVLTIDENEYVTTIKDKELIQELVNALENAEINTTYSVDWAGPDYHLLFKHNEEVLDEIGYCEEVVNLGEGKTGRYYELDHLYKVDIELPLD